jgi:hypothetical protein
MAGKWIQKARESMERKGTVGAFRKQTGTAEGKDISASKIAEARKSKNPLTKKRAVFAANMRKIARKKSRGGSRR